MIKVSLNCIVVAEQKPTDWIVWLISLKTASFMGSIVAKIFFRDVVPLISRF